MAAEAPRRRRRVSGATRLAVLLLPWLFLSVVVALLATFWWPGITHGHLLSICISPVLAVFFLAFGTAAVTFSRDVLAGRYP